MIFHPHALEQFTTRYDRTMSQDRARELLESATRYKSERTHTGEQYWDVPELGIRLITKRGTMPQDRGEEVCITVVPQAVLPVDQRTLDAIAESEYVPEDVLERTEDHVDLNAKVKTRGWVTYELKIEIELPELNQEERNRRLQSLQTKLVNFALAHHKKVGVKNATVKVTNKELRVIEDGMGD